MNPSESFECQIYLPRKQPDRDWIIDVCHLLWRHGMNFVTPHLVVGTWEEQLHTLPLFLSSPEKSLIDQIDELVSTGFGCLECYDHEVNFQLFIDTDLRGAEAFYAEPEKAREGLQLGKLELSVRYPVIDGRHRLTALPVVQAPASAYLIPPFQQIHLAMIHWVEILCVKLQPALAIGYYATNSYLTSDDVNEVSFYESRFLHGFDRAVIAALDQNQFPLLREWLESVYILYVPAHLMESPQANAWFSTPIMRRRRLPDDTGWAREWPSFPAMWRRPLPNGAWLAYVMPRTLDEVRVQDFITACNKLLRQRDRGQLPLARIYLQRAQEIEAVTPHVSTPAWLLEQLEYMEQDPDQIFWNDEKDTNSSR